MPNFLSRLFGTKPPAAPEPVLHKDCRIFPEPMKDAGGYRVAARVEKDFGGQVRTHQLIRADVHAAHDGAVEASVAKARQAIDQLGDSLFSDPA